jgi:light-regulated signal transduction histidine kinase (bacteriophytochrome)
LIPLIIINYLYKKKAALKFNKAYIYFAAFILLCGSTHFLDAMMFWVPMYRLNALIRLATAVISLLTVYHLIKILPEAFKQKTNVELEKEIEKREEAERKLEEANKNLEAFAYIASHDLQEPLRKIRTFSSILFESNRQQFDERSKELANKIVGSSERMHTMINDILSLSTISEDVELHQVDTSSAVASAMENLEVKISEKNAVVTIHELPNVIGHKAYLSQLFSNLIGNSLKFSKQQPIVTIRGEVQGDKALIYVSDNGIGMKEDDLQKIFQAFQRLNAKTEYEGSGIGLAICKRIVDIHGGSIKVNSKYGEGTTFIIELKSAAGKN